MLDSARTFGSVYHRLASCGLDFAEHLEALYVAVGLQRREHNVHQPQAEEQAAGEDLGNSWSAELPPDLRPAPVDENTDADEGEDGEERDREGQCSRVNLEFLPLRVVIDCCDGPGHTDTQEDINGVASCHVADGGVSILVLDGCHLAGKCVCKWESSVWKWSVANCAVVICNQQNLRGNISQASIWLNVS